MNPAHLAKYARFKDMYPEALGLIAQSARLAIAAGRRPSIRHIWEELRAIYGIHADDHNHAFAAREVMELYPDLKGAFQIRQRRPKNDNADPNATGGQGS